MNDPINNMSVKVFVDTNILGNYVKVQKDSYIICDRFPESKDFRDLMVFAKNNELNRFKICIPEMVLKEIQHQMIFDYNNAKNSYCDLLEKFKKVFGVNFKENHFFSHNSIEERRCFVDSEIKSFQERYSECVDILPHTNDSFPILLNKAVSQTAPFSKAKGSTKDYSDAGFKDAVILECLLQEAKNDNVVIILFSNDRVFSLSVPEYLKTKVFVFSEYNSVIDKLRNLYNLNEEKEIAQRFKVDNYLLSRVLDFVHLTATEQISLKNISSIDQDNNTDDTDIGDESQNVDEIPQTYTVKASLLVDGKTYTSSIRYDFSSNEVMNAEIEQEGE